MSCRTAGYGHRCFVQRRHRVLLRCGKAAAPAAGYGLLCPGAARAFQRTAFSRRCGAPLAGLDAGIGAWPRLRPVAEVLAASTRCFSSTGGGDTPCHPLRQTDPPPGWALLTPLWAKTLAPLQKPSALALPGNWQSKALHR